MDRGSRLPGPFVVINNSMSFVAFLSRTLLRLPPIRGVGILIEGVARLTSGLDTEVESRFDGSRFVASPRTIWGRRQLFTAAYHDRLERRWVRCLLRPGDYAVDVGANVGVYTLLFARLVGPSGRVTAIEADPANFAALSRNVILNGYDQVSLVAAGASDRRERLALHHHRDNLGMHSFVHDFGEGAAVVECHPLVDLMGPAPVRIMKLDIEGFEYRVLNGFFHSGGSLPEYLLIEEWKDAQKSELLNLCIRAGYVVYKHTTPNYLLKQGMLTHFPPSA